jgi:hypothetical protein
MRSEEPHVLAAEQAALRRVATLVARGVPQQEVFAAVTLAVGQQLAVDFAIMGRYEANATVTWVAAWGAPAAMEARLTQFTELLAMAIANAESHAGLARLAEEQVALRRVATLVAAGAPRLVRG